MDSMEGSGSGVVQNPFERVFVCVGTTEFDALVREMDSQDMLRLLEQNGCKELVMQIGRGSVVPLLLQESAARHGIAFSFFRFKPSLKECMQHATLIISHAGAGSITEALGMKKNLFVVVNESLMDNHQIELAEAVASAGYCYWSTPKALRQSLESATFYELGFMPDVDHAVFPALVDSTMGFEASR